MIYESLEIFHLSIIAYCEVFVENFLFTEGKVRIELNNDNDKSDFSEVFSFNHTIKKGRKKKKGNISRASDYFIV